VRKLQILGRFQRIAHIKMLLPINKSPFSSLETMEEKYALSLLLIGYAFFLKILFSPSLGFIASF
jgi:hypothetical protein